MGFLPDILGLAHPNLETLSSFAKYAGIVLTSALAIYAITHEFREGPEGRKKLTPPGRRAILSSALLFLVTVIGTKIDADLQAEKAQHDKEDLKNNYDLQTAKLGSVYDKARRDIEDSLRREYQRGQGELEDALKQVDTVSVLMTLHFPESLRRRLPGDQAIWGNSDFPQDWHFVGSDFFTPMLSFQDPKSKQVYLSSLIVQVSDDPYLGLLFMGCNRWRDRKDFFCPAEARIASEPFSLPEDTIPVEHVRYSGNSQQNRLSVQFRIDRTQLSKFKTEHAIVVRNFLSPRDFRPQIAGLLAFPPDPAESGVQNLVALLPSEIDLEVWVNDNNERSRTYRFVRSRAQTRLAEMGELRPLYSYQPKGRR